MVMILLIITTNHNPLNILEYDKELYSFRDIGMAHDNRTMDFNNYQFGRLGKDEDLSNIIDNYGN